MHRYLCYMHDMRRHTGTTPLARPEAVPKTGRERGCFLPSLPAVTAVIAGLGMCYSYCHDLLVICKVRTCRCLLTRFFVSHLTTINHSPSFTL